MDKKHFKKDINKQSRMILWYQFYFTMTSIVYLIFLLKYKVTYSEDLTVFTNNIQNQLLNSMSENGYPMIFGVLLGMLVILRYRKGKQLKIDLITENKKMTLEMFIKIFFVFMSAQILFIVVSNAFEFILNSFGYTAMSSIQSATAISATFSMFLYASIIGPITEEIIFRGALLRSLEKYGKIYAIVISSILFGFLHANFTQGLFASAVGLVFAYVTLEYSIKWAMILHLINNLLFGDVLGFLTNHMSLNIAEIFSTTLMLVLFIAGSFVLVKNKDSIKNYIELNKSEKNLYKYTFTSFFFLLFIIIGIMLALTGIEKMI